MVISNPLIESQNTNTQIEELRKKGTILFEDHSITIVELTSKIILVNKESSKEVCLRRNLEDVKLYIELLKNNSDVGTREKITERILRLGEGANKGKMTDAILLSLYILNSLGMYPEKGLAKLSYLIYTRKDVDFVIHEHGNMPGKPRGEISKILEIEFKDEKLPDWFRSGYKNAFSNLQDDGVIKSSRYLKLTSKGFRDVEDNLGLLSKEFEKEDLIEKLMDLKDSFDYFINYKGLKGRFKKGDGVQFF